MSGRPVCAQCHAELARESRFCVVCGTPRRQTTRRSLWLRRLAVITALLFIGLLGVVFWRSRPSVLKDIHVDAELQSDADRPALELPGVMRITYLDLGRSIQLSVESKANPILYVDRNQDHAVDKGDVSYAPLTDNHICIASLGGTNNSVCTTLGTSASVQVKQTGEGKTVTWKIPKAELGSTPEFADIVIRAFHEHTQQSEYYPAEPFQKVYRIVYLQGAVKKEPYSTRSHITNTGTTEAVLPTRSPLLPITPGKQPFAGDTPEIAQFEATPALVQSGETARLRWNVRGSTSFVEIRPDLGVVASQGERDISLSGTTRYLLKAKGPGGEISRELTVAVTAAPPPSIASFSSDAASVAPGGTARLRWSVTGPVSVVKIDPIAGILSASGSRDVAVGQTTNFVLTAEGPGGTVTNTLTVRAAPQPPAIVFDATPSIIHSGDAVVLRWAVAGTSQVTIQPGFGEVASNGSETIHPLVTTQYTLLASSPGGSTGKTVTINVSRRTGPSHGQLIWSGEIHGTQLVAVDRDRADVGSLEGSLPGEPCIVQPVNAKNTSIASSPGPRNQYQRLVFRVKGDGPMRVVIDWALQ